MIDRYQHSMAYLTLGVVSVHKPYSFVIERSYSMSMNTLCPQPAAETLIRGADGVLYRVQRDAHPVVDEDAAKQQPVPLQASGSIQTILSPTVTHPHCAVLGRHCRHLVS